MERALHSVRDDTQLEYYSRLVATRVIYLLAKVRLSALRQVFGRISPHNVSESECET